MMIHGGDVTHNLDAASVAVQRTGREIVGISERHWRSNRQVPVGFLRPVEAQEPATPRPPFACGACAGESMTVDVEGRVWGCQLFSSSIQELQPLGLDVAGVLDLGDIRDPAIEDRLAALPMAGFTRCGRRASTSCSAGGRSLSSGVRFSGR